MVLDCERLFWGIVTIGVLITLDLSLEVLSEGFLLLLTLLDIVVKCLLSIHLFELLDVFLLDIAMLDLVTDTFL